MTHLQAACRRLPNAPIVDGVPSRHVGVSLFNDSTRMLARGMRMLGYELKKESFRAYARLPDEPNCECRFYGPVRYLKQWAIVPGDGGPPRFISRLDVGLIA